MRIIDRAPATDKWPLEHDVALQALLTNGFSRACAAEEINKKFGTTYTRDAVIGRSWRKGFQSARCKDFKAPLTMAKIKKRQPHHRPVRDDRQPFKQPPAQAAAPMPIACAEVCEPRRISLIELTDETCRWPIGMPGTDDFCFCGSRPAEGSPYCAGHSRLAFREPEKRWK
jgi:GcrA cell cycle regulator